MKTSSQSLVTAYAWSKHTVPPCQELSYNQKIAFNFINPGSLNRGLRFKFFVETLELNSSKKKRSEYSRVLDLIESSNLGVYSYRRDDDLFTWGGRSESARLLTMQWSRVNDSKHNIRLQSELSARKNPTRNLSRKQLTQASIASMLFGNHAKY